MQLLAEQLRLLFHPFYCRRDSVSDPNKVKILKRILVFRFFVSCSTLLSCQAVSLTD